MRLADFIDSRLVMTDLQLPEGHELFDPLLDKICSVHTELDRAAILDRLLEREKKFSTGLECGIAVPHALVPGVEKTICLVARLAEPIEFGTLDGSLVGLLFLLISPQDSIATHIRLLARIARLCSFPAFLDRMLEAKDAGKLYKVIQEEDGKHV
jgi:PTS system nitrogen regulatory IIA component